MIDKCIWNCDQDLAEDDIYVASCGAAYDFISGGPIENNYKFCPSCGREIEQPNKREG